MEANYSDLRELHLHSSVDHSAFKIAFPPFLGKTLCFGVPAPGKRLLFQFGLDHRRPCLKRSRKLTRRSLPAFGGSDPDVQILPICP
jgi:hypothetical protein